MFSREFAVMNASYEFGDFPARPSQRESLSCTFAEVCPEVLKWDAGGDDWSEQAWLCRKMTEGLFLG
jgi:hypothetical protein